MPGDHLNSDQITRIFSGSTARIEEFFSKWNFANANSTQFAMSAGDKNLLGDKIAAVIDRDELTAILLETVRLLSRERDGLESLLNNDLCDKILRHAALKSEDGYPKSVHALMEAQKCLVNTMFHSAKMRDRFYLDSQNSENILQFLSEFDESQRKESKIEWIREMNQVQSSEVWYFYHRIAFIATAMNRDFQKSWANNPQMIDHLLTAVRCVLGKTSVPQIDLLRANEALKSFFNVFCHFHGEVEAINKKKAMEACEVLRDTICSVDIVGDDVIQSAIHALSVPPLPMILSVICGDPTVPLDTTSSIDNQSIEEEREFKNMTMIEALLMALDRQLARAVALLNSTPNDQVSQEANTLTDLTGPYFQALARLCVESKHVRRYCRIRVNPSICYRDYVEKWKPYLVGDYEQMAEILSLRRPPMDHVHLLGINGRSPI
ncbi:hypothetical protein GCK72_015398 [Caenorhabditis remanei]|uniref:Uncharacterized protein n=1 Tax=Caenorhabditis remanei TaxID=31234 RepID=A0A6A5GTY7_CAERE|nr:hypothetical protein GCK72_015398 [Caenorhabditis remanei]KAF1758938.1 hypothetical protein GCK72_015398 [Caenorhabditis remanei]